MTTQNRYIYGWEIEGFGTYAEYDSGVNLRIALENLIEIATPLATYVEGLVSLGETVSNTVEAAIGSTTQGTMQILVGGFDQDDVSGGRYAQAFLRFFWHSRPACVAHQTGSITSGATTLNARLIAGEDTIAPGDIIYLGREVMVVDAVGGSPPNVALTVVRGVLGSQAVAHDMLDVEIFKSNPVKLDRRVTFWEYDVLNDTETARFRGVVEDIDLSDETMVLCVTCRSLWGMVSKRRVAENRWEGLVGVRRMSNQANGQGEAKLFVRVPGRDSEPVVNYRPIYPDVPAGFLPGTEQYQSLGFDFKSMCLDIEGQAIAIRASEVTALAPGFVASYQHSLDMGFARQVDSQEFKAEYESKDYKAAEILVTDADSPLCLFRNDSGVASDHPADLILCLLTSTGTATWPLGGSHTAGEGGDYDWLPKPFGRGVPLDWIDRTAFERLRVEYPTRGLRARCGYVGAGKFKADSATMDMLGDLAQLMGCYLYETADAKLSIRRLADPGYGRTDRNVTASELAAKKNEGDGQAQTRNKPIYAIEMQIAQKGPKGEPGHVANAGGLEQGRLARYEHFAVKDKIDCTLIVGDPATAKPSGKELQLLGDIFKWRYNFLVDNLPQYRARLVEGEDKVAAGEWINLSHPYFFDNTTMDRGFSSHRCLVIDHKWEPLRGTQEAVVVDFTPATGANTLVTPSWRISAVTDATHFTLQDDRFSQSSGDRSKFVAGATYLVTLWTADGQLRSTSGAGATRYATAYNSGTGAVTLSGAFTAGLGSLTPAVGDVIRVATYDNATGWQTLAYTWLGDSAMTLGAANVSAGRWDV